MAVSIFLSIDLESYIKGTIFRMKHCDANCNFVGSAITPSTRDSSKISLFDTLGILGRHPRH